MRFSVGTRLGCYEILELISINMGEVYRARDTRDGREVVVKALYRDSELRVRFLSEYKSLASKLIHPNILAILDVGVQEETPYTVMESLEGETLRERLRRGRLGSPLAIEIGAAIAEGLTAAHACGIVHPDLKPENVFITRDGCAKVFIDLAHSAPKSTIAPGTVGYMSPEQFSGSPADERSDIFALGCVVFEMLTGAPAFRRGTLVETMNATLEDDFSISGAWLAARDPQHSVPLPCEGTGPPVPKGLGCRKCAAIPESWMTS